MTKFHRAMITYVVLGTAGGFMLSDDRIRYCLWIFLAGLAAKTAIAHYRPED